MSDPTQARRPEATVDPEFIARWSPRAFLSDPAPESDVASLFEAARWSPSSANEQPWTFLYATSDEDRALFASLLVEGNRRWAAHAPMLVFAVARRAFANNPFGQNGKPNEHAAFDTGAASMALHLQANKLGLSTHPMAGFDHEKVYEVLGVPKETHQVMAAIAIGRRGPPSALPPDLAAREVPSGRKALSEVAYPGRFRNPSGK